MKQYVQNLKIIWRISNGKVVKVLWEHVTDNRRIINDLKRHVYNFLYSQIVYNIYRHVIDDIAVLVYKIIRTTINKWEILHLFREYTRKFLNNPTNNLINSRWYLTQIKILPMRIHTRSLNSCKLIKMKNDILSMILNMISNENLIDRWNHPNEVL